MDKGEVILKAASESFRKYGYSKTSIAEIAKAAGVGKGTVYVYYKDKDELFYRVLAYNSNQLKQRIRQEIKAGSSADEKLRLMLTFIAMSIYEDDFIRSLLEEDFKLFSAYMESDIGREHGEEGSDFFTEVIKEGIENGEFNPGDAKMIASVLIASFCLVLVYMLKEKSAMERPEYQMTVDFLIDFYMRGICM